MDLDKGEGVVKGQPIFGYEHCSEGSGGGTYLTQFTDPLTNADQGAIVTWNQGVSPFFTQTTYTDVNGNVTTTGSVPGADYDEAHVTTINGSQVGSDNALQVAGRETQAYVRPVLQHENGDYIAWASSRKLIAFNAAGAVKWTKEVLTGADPLYALADGSTVYREGVYRNIPKQLVTLDANGNEQSRDSDQGLVPSWRGFTYQSGSVISVQQRPLNSARTFASVASGTAVLRYEPPQLGLDRIANSDLLAVPSCSVFLNNLANTANSNGRGQVGATLTKKSLAAQIKATAEEAKYFIYDGPTSETVWQQCLEPGCISMFPVWFTGTQEPNGYLIRDFFVTSGTQYQEGLSQYNGSAIWLRLFDWRGDYKGLFSQYITTFTVSPSKFGKVNYYGMGLLLHELLHKRTVGGGFTHGELGTALSINCEPGVFGVSHNACSDIIGQRCFPD
jgi:hypothetical protein